MGVRQAFKLPNSIAAFEIDPTLIARQKKINAYHPSSKFPSVNQDITLKVSKDVSYQQLYSHTLEQLNKSILESSTYYELTPLSIFSSDSDQDHVNYSFRLNIADFKKTLNDKEVNQLLDDISLHLSSKLQATRV